VAAILCLATGTVAASGENIFDSITDNWRWSHYWFGRSAVDDVYVEGKNVTAALFWTKTGKPPIKGVCSAGLALCAAYVGEQLDPRERLIRISPTADPRDAFASWHPRIFT